jgi:E3 ubiquitin-protein ligase BAH
MSAVVGCFNKRAKKLLEIHLASGLKKYMLWFVNKSQRSHRSLIQEGKDLVTYAIINSIAMRKILKKYDKASVFFFKCMSMIPRKFATMIRVI